MNYCMVEDETIVNMIVCEDDTTAELFGAVPAYEGARIGDPYAPPSPAPPEPTAEDIPWICWQTTRNACVCWNSPPYDVKGANNVYCLQSLQAVD